MLKHFDQLYVCRPSADEIFYLNAWEFIMWWRVVPKGRYRQMRATYVAMNRDPDATWSRAFVLEYRTEVPELREHYILMRRTRPVVPAPSHMPLPSRVPRYPETPGRQYEEQCRLYCVYMRPWTLLRSQANVHVPFIAHLNRPAALRQRRLSAKTQPSYAQSWRWYSSRCATTDQIR